MAVAARVIHFASAGQVRPGAVWLVRVALIVAVLGLWEIVARSGWLFRDVVPTLPVIARAVVRLLADPSFYANLAVTGGEIAAALAIGGAGGLLA